MFYIDKPLTAADALLGRKESMIVPVEHFVNQHAIRAPFPEGVEILYLGMGCFWGAEQLFWKQPGVWVTAVGYSGGYTPNPYYEEVCSGMTGHAEVVLIAYQPKEVSCQALLKLFWEKHNPTQGMRQGNDRGSQYRSVIYTSTQAQLELALTSKNNYQNQLTQAKFSTITTEIKMAPLFYYAESYHQQYLAKKPDGYCNIGGTGVCFL